jgi:hypothetical protein
MKRFPIIRHLRWFYLTRRVHLHARRWAQLGIGLGYPNESDLQYLDAIWRGDI